ncbi:hypothetical protein MUB24_10265 [Lederbergia sp. NSJ-179]|uniref:type IV toxin-antitoxin system AbiEi family antitoxin domain-containing protein n=1 Tax=Lederbergia sp. NSJ-179 TaxID=2931402 RepID=UPI001FD12A8D|nr:hypothetical protein [Lederbergia sp. NSJ-179]MCJ7841277.1 hypothetical protein [Lederbergia sp. NSJ-179]
MDVFQYLLQNYGYDEPIFLDDLKSELDMNSNTLRQSLKRAVDNGKLCRYEYKDGIYFIPNPKSLLKKKTISVNKIISKKYLYKKGKRIGYLTGLSLANHLQLTTQNPGVVEIVTMNEATSIRIVKYNKRRIALRRSRVSEINENNYKVLQVLDLVNSFDKLSTKPFEEACESIIDYVQDVSMDKNELDDYLKKYPYKTQAKILGSTIYDELTQR